MTTSQAHELLVKWKQCIDAPKGEHLNLELKWSDTGI